MIRHRTIAALMLAATLLAGCSTTSGANLKPAEASTTSPSPKGDTTAEGVSQACINAVVGVENNTVDSNSVIATCVAAGDSIDAIQAYVDSVAGTPSPTARAKPKPKTTVAQREAIESAKSYLEDGAFSRAGLIKQLDSKYGEGFKKSDAVYAVDHIKVNWYSEAVESARSYLDDGGFSRAGLIQQLHSSYGEGFTLKQATYAVNKVGL
jgi:hypothetical protein